MFVVPLINSGSRPLNVAIEPEGDWFVLEVGQSMEIKCMVEAAAAGIELDVTDELISIWCMATKEVWISGAKVR